MKRKINGHFMAVAGLAILATLTLLVFIFYNLLANRSWKTCAHTLICCRIPCTDEQQAQEVLKRNQLNHDEVRFTVISADGTVLFDNDVNASEMENHADRPEVKKAFENRGRGRCAALQYPVAEHVLCSRGSAGRIGRAGCPGNRQYLELVWRAVPAMIVVLCLLMVVCFLLSNILTKRLIRPIEALAEHLDDPQNKPVYPELRPFVETIRSQHAEIIKAPISARNSRRMSPMS